MVRYAAICALFLFALSSCVHGGITSHFPKSIGPNGNAKVIIARPDSVWGGALRFQAGLDGYEIAVLGPGEYVSFHISSGQHSIGEVTGSQFSMEFEGGITYYFIARMHTEFYGSTFYLSRSDKDEIGKYLKNSRDISSIPYRAIQNP